MRRPKDVGVKKPMREGVVPCGTIVNNMVINALVRITKPVYGIERGIFYPGEGHVR